MNKTRDNAEIVLSEWFPSAEEYSPGLSVQAWKDLLADETVFTAGCLAIMKRFKDFGGMATCKQLSRKYGCCPNFYTRGSSALARRIARATGCPVPTHDTENSKWWPILYVGKYTTNKADGVYIWQLRPELSEALDQIDLSTVPLYEGNAILESSF